MKNEKSNPLFEKSKHLITASGMYPAGHVDIFWNTNSAAKITEVEAVLAPRYLLSCDDDNKLQNDFSIWNKKWSNDLGVSCAGWMSEMTPASIFGYMLQTGFASQDELIAALKEFAHIEECEWARDMHKGFFKL